MIEVFTERFGPYPFASLGSTVFADTSFNAALETQGMIGDDRSAVSERTIAHEVAHQWFGNSVSLDHICRAGVAGILRDRASVAGSVLFTPHDMRRACRSERA